MNVFIIEYVNLEPYEDGFNWIGEVFKTESDAVMFLKGEGFVEEVKTLTGMQVFVKELNEFEAISATIACRKIKEETI